MYCIGLRLICVLYYYLRSTLVLYLIYVPYCTWVRADFVPQYNLRSILILYCICVLQYNLRSIFLLYIIYVPYCTQFRAELCTLIQPQKYLSCPSLRHKIMSLMKNSQPRLCLSVPGLGLISILEHYSRSISILRNIIYRCIVNLKYKQ